MKYYIEWIWISMSAELSVLSFAECEWTGGIAWLFAAIWALIAMASEKRMEFWRERYCHAAGTEEDEA